MADDQPASIELPQLTPEQATAALPALGRELVKVIGFDQTMALIAERGGQRVNVASWPQMRHSSRFEAMVEIIGMNAAQKFGDRWGGIEIQVPTLDRITRLRKVKGAIRDYSAGVRVPELARRYGTTESTIFKWLKKPV